jgi:hypothetical protein
MTAMAEKSFTVLFRIEYFFMEESEHQIYTGSDVVLK